MTPYSIDICIGYEGSQVNNIHTKRHQQTLQPEVFVSINPKFSNLGKLMELLLEELFKTILKFADIVIKSDIMNIPSQLPIKEFIRISGFVKVNQQV